MSDSKKWRRLAPVLPMLALIVFLLAVFPALLHGRALPDAEPSPTVHTPDEVGALAFCDSVTEIPTAECQALVDLYNGTNGSSWTNRTGWLVTYTPCSWYGVTCQGGHVLMLDLSTTAFATLSGRVYEGTTGQEPPLSTPDRARGPLLLQRHVSGSRRHNRYQVHQRPGLVWVGCDCPQLHVLLHQADEPPRLQF